MATDPVPSRSAHRAQLESLGAARSVSEDTGLGTVLYGAAGGVGRGVGAAAMSAGEGFFSLSGGRRREVSDFEDSYLRRGAAAPRRGLRLELCLFEPGLSVGAIGRRSPWPGQNDRERSSAIHISTVP